MEKMKIATTHIIRKGTKLWVALALLLLLVVLVQSQDPQDRNALTSDITASSAAYSTSITALDEDDDGNTCDRVSCVDQSVRHAPCYPIKIYSLLLEMPSEEAMDGSLYWSIYDMSKHVGYYGTVSVDMLANNSNGLTILDSIYLSDGKFSYDIQYYSSSREAKSGVKVLFEIHLIHSEKSGIREEVMISEEIKFDGYDNPEKIQKILATRRERSKSSILKGLDFSAMFVSEVKRERSLDKVERGVDVIADAVRDHGLCIVRNVFHKSKTSEAGNGILHPLRDDVLPAAEDIEQKLNLALRTRDIHPSGGSMFQFREATSRYKGRTDVLFADLGFIEDENMSETRMKIFRNPKLYPIIQKLLGVKLGNEDTHNIRNDAKLVYAGLIFSYPGSIDQPWHQDGMPLFPELSEEDSSKLQGSLPPYAATRRVTLL